MIPFISADNTWALWAVMVAVAWFSIWLEQKYSWANKLTGCVIALIIMMALANMNVIPTDAPAYDNVWSYVVPLAVPLLLFNCNITKIFKETGKLMVVYLFSAVGTVIGSLIGAFTLGSKIPQLQAISAMFTGTYTGGSVNLAAMAQAYNATGEIVSSAVVADNLLMAIYFFVLIAMPGITFFRKNYNHPLIDGLEREGANNKNYVAEYWKPKPIALRDIAFDFAAAAVIVAVSRAIAAYLGKVIPTGNVGLNILNTMLGNQYLIITTLTMTLATAFPNVFGQVPGANELGTFLIYIFFAVIGAPASITLIARNSPILFVYATIVVMSNMIVTLVFGKIFKFSLEDMIVASNANVGGPTTSAAMAISKGWTSLVGPALLVGTFGYVLGNYLGLLVANIVGV